MSIGLAEISAYKIYVYFPLRTRQLPRAQPFQFDSPFLRAVIIAISSSSSSPVASSAVVVVAAPPIVVSTAAGANQIDRQITTAATTATAWIAKRDSSAGIDKFDTEIINNEMNMKWSRDR